jgi:hypothetical protein
MCASNLLNSQGDESHPDLKSAFASIFLGLSNLLLNITGRLSVAPSSTGAEDGKATFSITKVSMVFSLS